jgi:DinB family protein
MRLHACLRALTTLIVITAAAPFCLAQDAGAHPDPTLRDALAGQWTEITNKIATMAADFPDAKYDFRPSPEVRTFADQLRHVGFWNLYVVKSMKGEKIDPAINELSKTEYPTKASIVAVLKSTASEAAALLKQQESTPPVKIARLFNTFTEHAGEHYGQLVVYYRLNGLVPPESRGNKD